MYSLLIINMQINWYIFTCWSLLIFMPVTTNNFKTHAICYSFVGYIHDVKEDRGTLYARFSMILINVLPKFSSLEDHVVKKSMSISIHYTKSAGFDRCWTSFPIHKILKWDLEITYTNVKRKYGKKFFFA